ncbi:hypothetical protein C8F04DRAFT_691078 [Mycena alexandri]|uniref:Uncharacterized protein n=1 Tax=Mycena alexandri TaxID=1745969 RepID=A0AAD6XG96_9AGAR|nr:hypothetical protein C8F04DRAFT_691078 [Mycena alexandri]
MRRSCLPTPRSTSRSFFPPPSRIVDEAPPRKRQRRSSTPRRSRASSSASPDDLKLEREASATRMVNVWANLAAKYSRLIDEDDIVDLVTVKDRGVLSAEISWKFPRSSDTEDVDESTGTDEDDEDDVDELDAFTRPEEVVAHLDWTAVQPVPPVREMDPADAKEDNLEHEDVDDMEAAVFPASPRVAVNDSDDELGTWGIVDESNTVSFTVENAEIITSSHSQSRSPSPIVTSSKPPNSPHSKKISKVHLAPTHLLTPPRSTLSSTDEFLTPVLASPPSSPPPSQSSSPTKPKSKVGLKRVDKVRTRSQSRARSQAAEESCPRLDLNDARRGRSARTRLTRSSAPKPREESARVDQTLRPSARRCQPSPSPSPQQQQQAQRRDKGRRGSVDKLGISDRKGKGKAIDVEPPVQDDHWAEESDDPLRLSSSPTRPGQGKLSHRSRMSRPEGDSRSTPEVEYTALPPSPVSLPQRPRKRRRKSSSDNEDLRPLDLHVHDTGGSSRPFEASSSKNMMRSSAVSKAAVELNYPDSEPGRTRHTPAPVPPYYPPPVFYPYPYAATDVHPAMPLPDPRAFIISQAIHQLSTLFTSPYSAQPLTPRHPSSSSTFGFSPYSHLPFHPHTPLHPFVFESNAGASTGTLPTSSLPASETSSSSPLCAHSGTAKPSLVPRSRSRGRHVSFKMDEDPPNDVVTVTRQRQRTDDSGSVSDAGSE